MSNLYESITLGSFQVIATLLVKIVYLFILAQMFKSHDS